MILKIALMSKYDYGDDLKDNRITDINSQYKNLVTDEKLIADFRFYASYAQKAYCLESADDMLMKGLYGKAEVIADEIIFFFKELELNKMQWEGRPQKMVNYPYLELGLVDAYFWEDYSNVSHKVKEKIKDLLYSHKKITLIGHGIAGVYATFTALELQYIPRFTHEFEVKVYTFGSPRIGNSFFAQHVKNKLGTIYRVTHTDDYVSQFPEKKGRAGYVHYETEFWISFSCDCPEIYQVFECKDISLNSGVNESTFHGSKTKLKRQTKSSTTFTKPLKDGYPEKYLVINQYVLEPFPRMARAANFAYCFNENRVGIKQKGVVADVFLDSRNKEIVAYFRGQELTLQKWKARNISLKNYKIGTKAKVDKSWSSDVKKMKPRLFNRIRSLLKTWSDSIAHLWDDFIPYVNVRFVGHGVGGAYAVIAALALQEEYDQQGPTFHDLDVDILVTVFTFGQPRTGNKDFAKLASAKFEQNLHRITHSNDFIPRLFMNQDIFGHSGNEFWIPNQSCDCSYKSQIKTVESAEDFQIYFCNGEYPQPAGFFENPVSIGLGLEYSEFLGV
ncbi:hypothetical protein G9A89_006759 [Geosiphon pyriformis]|nr:hypothetical protein G9A89_006759 [Geosiphon pyriformis]